MSNIYIKEPATSGKVILKTTLGDIDCELWSREAPKACRNFVQLCMEGYYNGTIFHRVLKGFIAQGGDPTGTGFGGESIYGESFKDEFHSRLRFVRRGLLAMANAEKDSNGSQFFFTLGACPELQDKHTIFGKVTGNTLYNMIKFDELQVDQNDRPLYPPKILSTEIVLNPFDDIVSRKTETKKVTKKEERPKVKGTKDFKLLSFGDEAEEEEEAVDEVIKGFKGKSKSSHDLLNDPKLSSIPAVEPLQVAINKRLKGDVEDKMTSEDTSEEDEDDLRTTKKRKKNLISEVRAKFITNSNPFGEGTSKDFTDELLEEDPMCNKDDKQLKLEQLRRETKQLKKSLFKKKETEETKPSEPEKQLDPLVADHKQEINKLKAETLARKRTKAEDTLAKLTKFREKLQQLKNNQPSEGDDEAKIALFTHKMVSEETEPVLAKDANLINEADWFDIHDPRHPVNKRRREPENEKSGAKRSNNHNKNRH